MRSIKYQLLVLFCFCFSIRGESQQDILVSQYMFNQLFLNPAYSGTHEYWETSILYRNQWTGWEGAPESQMFAVDGPALPNLIGVGGTIIHDKIGISESLSANLNASYQLKLDYKGNHRISFGLKAGIYSQRAYLKDLIYLDEDDPIYQGSDILTQNTILFGTGLYYYSKKMYLGLSIPMLFAKDLKDLPTQEVERNSYLKNQYYLNGGMVFTLSESIDFKPSFLLKYAQSSPLQLDINLHFLFNKILWLGLSYRTNDIMVFMIEANLKKWIRLGYAYDITFGDLSKYSTGSHEIMLGIDFGKTIVKSSSPRYF